MAWLRKHDDSENVLLMRRACAGKSINEADDAALDLVDQVADLIRDIEEHAAQTDLRARRLAQDAVDRLQAAQGHIQSLEIERRALEAGMNEANMRFLELEKTLKRTETRIAAAEAHLSAAELQASAAENRAIKAEKTITDLTDAIHDLLRQKRKGADFIAAA